MAHNRKLALGAVALTMARVPAKKVGAAANRVRDELEQEIMESNYLEGAPFKWVGLMIREGLINETKPHYNKIDTSNGELPVAIEINAHLLVNATEDEIAAIYRKATLVALVHIGEKYGLKTRKLQNILLKLS